MSVSRVVIGVIWRGREILIAQRLKNGSYPFFWEFPGGRLEPGETEPEGLKREIQEELGVHVKVVRALFPLLYPAPSGWLLIKPYDCLYLSGRPRALGCRGFKWVLPADLRRYRFPPANAPLLREISSDQRGLLLRLLSPA